VPPTPRDSRAHAGGCPSQASCPETRQAPVNGKLADGQSQLERTAEITTDHGAPKATDDFEVGGSYDLGLGEVIYTIRIDSEGTFTWGSGGTFDFQHAKVPITGDWQELSHAVKIRFPSKRAYSVGSLWFLSYDGPEADGIRIGHGTQKEYIDGVRIFGPGAVDLNSQKNAQPSAVFDNEITGLSYGPNFKELSMQQWNINIQREFSRDWLVTAGYAGSRGTHIPYLRDLNSARYIPGASTAADVNQRRPLAPYFSRYSLIESVTNSSYNSLQASMDKRLSRGVSVLVSYTFFKAFTDLNTCSSTTAAFRTPTTGAPSGAPAIMTALTLLYHPGWGRSLPPSANAALATRSSAAGN
jgi:hypothetical protein